MKKIALLVLALSLVLVCALALASCTKKCEHDYVKDEAASTAATCDVAGKNVLKCSKCGDVKEEDVAALGHQYGAKKTTAPVSCLVNGEKAKVCSVCGAKSNVEVLTAPGHTWNEVATVDVEPSCVEGGTNGSKSIKCSVCDAKKDGSDETVAWEHTPATEYTVDLAPTCTAEGTESLYCTVCKAQIPDSSKAVNALGHQLGAWAVTAWPTDVVAGSKTRKCIHEGCTLPAETAPIAVGAKMTEAYAFRTYADWTEEAKQSGAWGIPCEAADETNGILKFTYDAAKNAGKSGRRGFKMDLTGANIASGADFIITYSLYAEATNPEIQNPQYPIWTIRAVVAKTADKEEKVTCPIGIEYSAGKNFQAGDIAEWDKDYVIANAADYTEKWVNIALVFHNATKAVDMYVNGVNKKTWTYDTLPADLSTLDFFTAQESASYNVDRGTVTFYIDNLAVYQGTYSDAEAAAIFAANSNDFTVSLPAPAPAEG